MKLKRGSRYSIAMAETFWHIAHHSYCDGDDLLCRDLLVKRGCAPEWHWDDAPEGFDGNVVCMFPDTPKGRVEADWYWDEQSQFVLLRVEVPDESAYLVGEVEEGYPAMDHRIPSEWITVIRRGYAENVVTREGDEY
jgi:hypothetical protein